MKQLAAFFLLFLMSAPAFAGDTMWVNDPIVERHTCPASNCGVVGTLAFRERAEVFEQKNGWARITEPYAAGCKGGGTSPFVLSGGGACLESNGISNDMMSEWVQLKSLVRVRPNDPGDAPVTGNQNKLNSPE